MDIFFYNPDIVKMIEEADYLQGLDSRPAIHRTLNAEYKERALEDLDRRFILARSSQKFSSPLFKELPEIDKNIADIADSLDVEYLEKLRSEKKHKEIISVLQKTVARLENYGVKRFMDEYQTKRRSLQKFKDDEDYLRCEEIYQKLSIALGAYGHALKEEGNLNSASHYLNKATDMNPYDWELYYDMASIHEKKKEYSKAINLYRAAGDLSDTGAFLSDIESKYSRNIKYRKRKEPKKEKQKIFYSKIEELTELASHKESWWTSFKKQLSNIWRSIKSSFSSNR